jgi:dienelactone hydrolase
MFAERECSVRAGDKAWPIVVRTPAKLAARPALLVNLAWDRRTSLDGDYYRIVPDVFLAAGHRVAAFDMPNHGERADRHGSGLVGMAAAIADGNDVFRDVRAAGRALVDWAVREGLCRTTDVLVCGTSRGGLAALHVMAGDERIAACAAICPVTYLPALSEFAALAGNRIIEESNAEVLVPALAARPVFLAMGERDPRVDSDRCFRFHARLTAVSRIRKPVLFTAPGESHGAATFPVETAHFAAAAFLLGEFANQARLPTG